MTWILWGLAVAGLLILATSILLASLASLAYAAILSIEKFRKWRTYLNSVSELSKLTDLELKDIGIVRGDIERVAREHAVVASTTDEAK